jgi:hypothetical protein
MVNLGKEPDHADAIENYASKKNLYLSDIQRRLCLLSEQFGWLFASATRPARFHLQFLLLHSGFSSDSAAVCAFIRPENLVHHQACSLPGFFLRTLLFPVDDLMIAETMTGFPKPVV